MEPAYPITINERQRSLIGELAVILGQIDVIMERSVNRILGKGRAAASKAMRSPKVEDRALVWSTHIRGKHTDASVIALVDEALAAMAAIAPLRNDFIHGWYNRVEGAFSSGFDKAFDIGFTTAKRKNRTTDIEALAPLRDQAARLSCLVAHIDHLLGPFATNKSDWIDRLNSIP